MSIVVALGLCVSESGYARKEIRYAGPLPSAYGPGHCGSDIHIWRRRPWAQAVLGAALGITVYWPVVVLASAVAARGAPGWNLPNETAYWIVPPLIALWGILGLWRIRSIKV